MPSARSALRSDVLGQKTACYKFSNGKIQQQFPARSVLFCCVPRQLFLRPSMFCCGAEPLRMCNIQEFDPSHQYCHFRPLGDFEDAPRQKHSDSASSSREAAACIWPGQVNIPPGFAVRQWPVTARAAQFGAYSERATGELRVGQWKSDLTRRVPYNPW